MLPNEKAVVKTLLILVAADTLAIVFGATLVANRLATVPGLAQFVSFLFWANYRILEARLHPAGVSWKSLAVEVSAGIWLSGAVRGLFLYREYREWSYLFGVVFVTAFGAYVFRAGRRLRKPDHDKNEDAPATK